MIDATSVYDFETLIQSACATFFSSVGFSTLTPEDKIELQKIRPRLEIVFKVNGAVISGQQGASLLDPQFGQSSGLTRAAAYKGELHLGIVANSTETDVATVSQWRAAVRWYAEQLPIRLISPKVLLTTLSLRKVVPAGSVMLFKNDQGYWSAGLIFNVDFALVQSSFNQPQFQNTN